MSILSGEGLLFLLHPARLIAAAVGATAVAMAGIATPVLAARLGAGPPTLAMVLGGIIALNVLLFFPPGALGRHPGRFVLVLASNIVPLLAVVWLARHQPVLAQLLLVLCAGGAALARPFGPIPAAAATTIVMNLLLALLLGSAARFPEIATVAVVIGCLAGFAADALAQIPFGGMARLAERALLAGATASFLEQAAWHWSRAGEWGGAWLEAEAKRLAALAADLAPSAESPAPALLHHLIGAIGRVGRRLVANRDALGTTLSARIGETFANLAAAVRGGSAGQPVLGQLRSDALARPRISALSEKAAVDVLGLWLLLDELVQSVLLRSPVISPAPHHKAALGPPEIRIALQAVVSVAIAVLATHVLPVQRPYWIPLTTVILTSTSFGETIRKSYERLLGTVAGLLAGELIWLALAGRPAATTAALMVAVAGIFFSRSGAYRWMLAWVTLALVVLLNEAGQASLLVDGRLADTLVGLAIVLVVTRFLLPVRAKVVAEARARALLAIVATALRDVTKGQSDRSCVDALETALAGLRVISDAELLEAGLKRGVRERVRVRLGAAERIAGVLISFAAMPADFRPAPETAAALAATAELAEQAAAGGVPLRMDIAEQTRALLARADGSGHIRFDLHVLSLLAVLVETIPTLAASTAPRLSTAPDVAT
ncbi:MAG: FUSC family protein [Acetobacteraceae bacterium]